jgi:hypothetical protein
MSASDVPTSSRPVKTTRDLAQFPSPDPPDQFRQSTCTKLDARWAGETSDEQFAEAGSRRLGALPLEITFLLVGGSAFSTLASVIKALLTVPPPP